MNLDASNLQNIANAGMQAVNGSIDPYATCPTEDPEIECFPEQTESPKLPAEPKKMEEAMEFQEMIDTPCPTDPVPEPYATCPTEAPTETPVSIDDGKISFGEKMKSFFKGFADGIKKLIS